MAHLDRQTGRWRVSWVDAKGKRRSQRLPFGTRKQEAVEIEGKLRLGIIRGDKKRITFGEWAEIWIREYAERHQSPSTLKKTKAMVSQHLIPRFGRVYLDNVDTRDAINLQGDLLGRGYAIQSINNTLSVLSQILKYAVYNGKIQINPASAVKRQRRQDKTFDFWTPKEVSLFLIKAREINYEVYRVCAFALHTGLRPGEMRGLLVDALDFKHNYVFVNRNYCTKTNQLLGYTKTRQNRKVPVPQFIMQLLADKKSLSPTDYVFEGVSWSTFSTRWIKPIAELAKVKPIRFHDLRHSFASNLIAAGVHVVEVKELLGHKKLETTMRYIHLAPDRNQGITEVLGQDAAWLNEGADVVSMASRAKSGSHIDAT